MQIVTDSGTDLCLPAEEVEKLNIHVLPLVVTLEGKSYREGVDMTAEDFYKLLAAMESFPSTSTPSPGDFAATYRRLAATDPEILSIHMSSGLSGTFNSARVAAESIPEAKVTVIDTKTLSAAAGWQVSAAAKAIKAGWNKEQVLALIQNISTTSDSLFTLDDLKYLIHGGRISQMKGLIASLLNIRPMIGVEKIKGTYVQMGQARTFRRAVEGLVDLIARKHAPGSALRAQVLHALNPDGAGILHELIDKRFTCSWLPTAHLSLVLGAHTGTSMVGVAYAPAKAFADMP
jgi:DegV family protein with EDD domain